LSQPLEYFVVERSLGSQSNSVYCVDFGGNNNALLQQANSTVLQLYPGPSSGSVSANADHYINCSGSGANSFLAVDGFLQTTGTVTANPTGFEVGNYGGGATSQAWNGFIYEVIVYNRVLANAQRVQVWGYLSGRYLIPLP
jgi:hypothetical protein